MWQSLKVVWSILSGHRLRYFAAIFVLVFASCFLYLVPLLPQITLDGVLSSTPQKASAFVQAAVAWLGGREWLRQNLWWPALLLVTLSVIAGVLTYFRGHLSAQASESIVREMRDRVYAHLQHLPSKYFDKAETGDLIQRCTSDVETLRLFLSSQIVEIGRAIIMLLVPLPLMFAIHPGMALVSIVFIPLVILFSLFYFLKVRTVFQETDEAEASMTATLQENLAGIRVVRAFARQSFEEDKFGEKNVAHRNSHYKLYTLLAHFWATSDLLCFLQTGAVLGFGIYWLAQGALQVGAFYFFLTAVNMFIWPVRMMGRILTELGKASVALERLYEILVEPTEDGTSVAGSGSQPALPKSQTPALQGGIEFKNVDFSYGREPVLRDISFQIKPGQTLALVGPSGSGKTTLLQLLLRLYDYEKGSIRIDGHELRTIARKWVRAHTATVMQQPFLFSKTLFENIKLGAPRASKDEVYQATQSANIHRAISDFDEGYNTKVGERGVTLSGGQRQRTALARALIQDPKILILDDAMSAVDLETEAEILSALERRNKQHTTILVAHRLSTLMHADHILVMEEGRVVQAGKHEALLEEEGLYRKLWELQRAVESVEHQSAA